MSKRRLSESILEESNVSNEEEEEEETEILDSDGALIKENNNEEKNFKKAKLMIKDDNISTDNLIKTKFTELPNELINLILDFIGSFVDGFHFVSILNALDLTNKQREKWQNYLTKGTTFKAGKQNSKELLKALTLRKTFNSLLSTVEYLTFECKPLPFIDNVVIEKTKFKIGNCQLVTEVLIGLDDKKPYLLFYRNGETSIVEGYLDNISISRWGHSFNDFKVASKLDNLTEKQMVTFLALVIPVDKFVLELYY
ncbi:hypothetical protein ABK040_013652 [Willaertia magna]